MNLILETLNRELASLDAQVLEGTKKWALERKAALTEYKKSDEYKEIAKKGAWGGMYDALYAVAGGKTWYNVFNGNGTAYVEEFVEKNCAKTVEKRNASIAKKLEKAGVTEVVSNQFSRTNDGFNGIFIVNTDAGTKRVIIESILAGGYNIQCLHNRVLVKVK